MGKIQRSLWWGLWRGSVELLLRVVNAAADSVSAETGKTDVPVSLIVETGYDQEQFASIEAFQRFVTPEALREFNWINLRAGFQNSVYVQVLWSRQGPWLPIRIPGQAPRKPAVQLYVAGNDPPLGVESIERITARVGVALNRGFHRWDAHWRSPFGLLLSYSALFTALIFAVGALFHPHLQGASGWTVVIVFYLAPLAILLLVFNWLLPVVEIAPDGQSRLERLRKSSIAILLGLIGAGIARRAF